MGIVALALIPLLFLLPWRSIAGDSPRRTRTGTPLPETARAWPLKEALRTRPYWQLVQVFAFTSIGMMSVLAQVVPFLVDIALTPLEAATAFGVAGLLSVFGIMASGWFADRIGYRATATTSFASSPGGMPWLISCATSSTRASAADESPAMDISARSSTQCFSGSRFSTVRTR